MGGFGLYVDMASGIHAYRNIAYNNANAGFAFGGVWRDGDSVYYNNVVANSLYGFRLMGSQFDTHGGSLNTQLLSNTLLSNEGFGILLQDNDGILGNMVLDHNLYYNNGWRSWEDGGVWDGGAMTVQVDGAANEYYRTMEEIQAAFPWEDHGQTGDPHSQDYDFDDHDLHDGSWPDFHLTADSDKAIDRGTAELPASLTALLTLFGVEDARHGTAFDIGRYEAGVDAPTVHSISLVAGSNLLAWPLEPLPNAETALDEIGTQGGNASEVYRWSREVDAWEGYMRDRPFNNFDMELGEGYFFKAAKASTWTRTGQPPADPVPVQLSPSWTLLGLPKLPGPMTAQGLLDEATAQGGQCTEIYRWHNGWWDGHSTDLAGSGFELADDVGYFVKCANRITYVPGQGTAQQASPDRPAAAQQEAPPPVVDAVISDVLVTGRRDTAFRVTWRTDRPSQGWIEYGETEALGQAVHEDGAPAASRVHQVTVTGLRPETNYYFRVHAGDAVDDGDGVLYQVSTQATVLPPAPRLAYGQVQTADGTPAVGALVRVWLVDADGNRTEPWSVLVDAWGYWTLVVGLPTGLWPSDDCGQVWLELETWGAGGEFVRQTYPLCECQPAPTVVLGPGRAVEAYLPVVLQAMESLP
jgi:hypothetical protein